MISISLLYLSHIFTAYSTGSQPFIHLLNPKAIPNHSHHSVIHQIRGMIWLIGTVPKVRLKWLSGRSVRLLQDFVYLLSLGLIIWVWKQMNKGSIIIYCTKVTQYLNIFKLDLDIGPPICTTMCKAFLHFWFPRPKISVFFLVCFVLLVCLWLDAWEKVCG